MSWRGTILKMIILLIFPLYLILDTGGVWTSSSFFLLIWTSLSFSFSLQSSPIQFDWHIPTFSIIFAIFLMLPAIYFDRKIKAAPISSSMKRKAIASAVGTWLFSFGSSFLIYIIAFMPGVVDPYMYFEITSNAMNSVPTLAIPLFIIWPILKRELVIRSVPLNQRTLSYSYLSRVFKDQIGKQRFLPLILWFGLLLSPIMNYQYWSLDFISPLYSAIVYTNFLIREAILPFPYSTVTLTIIPMYILPVIALIFSLRYFFVRDIYRFKDRRIPKSRLISVGLLVEIAPVALMSIFGWVTTGYYIAVTPVPAFALLGFLYVWRDKSPPLTEEIWDDEEHKMWYESEKPPPPQMEPGIKVPITYMIMSQFRRLRRH
ncbi:MAG: hypothetical protein ACFFEL_07380 [Candidatus Thorarchaeota archaeon]